MDLNNIALTLSQNGITTFVVEDREAAKQKIKDLIPDGAEVMTMTSVTLDTLNIVRTEIRSSAPDYAIGSVHAVTEDGHVLIASATGSQLPAYVYGAKHVVWIVGQQKIVKNVEEGIKRIYDYVLPLESERAHKAYGVPGSAVNKLLIFNKEVTPNRVHLILVKENLGF